MDPIVSQIDPSSDVFARKREAMLELVQKLADEMHKVRYERDPKSLAYIEKQGKLPVWTRVEKLLDPGAPFLELCPLAAHEMYEGQAPGAGSIIGIGVVAGRRVMINANDPTIKGGTIFPMGVKKAQTLRLHQNRVKM